MSLKEQVLGGQYKIEKALDSGGMGTVYLALHLLTGQKLAIKMLRPELTADPEVRERFLSEGRVLASLEHPYIVQWKNSFQEAERYYLVMQFISGSNVSERIEKERFLSLEEVVPMALQTLSALAFCHENGVVHRDLKPANLLLNEKGDIKVTDFGISRIIGKKRLTEPGMAIGTYVYMAPEQLLGKENDHRVDIYSLGITLYEMLTGELPFQGDTTYEICRKHLEEPFPLLRKLRPDLPYDMECILLRATEKNPDKRFQNAQEFLTALAQAFPQHSWPVLKPLGMNTHKNLLSVLQKESQKKTVITSPPSVLAQLTKLFFYLLLFLGIVLGVYLWMEPSEKKDSSKQGLPYHDSFATKLIEWDEGSMGDSQIVHTPFYSFRAQKGQGILQGCAKGLQELSFPFSIMWKARLHEKPQEMQRFGLLLKAASPFQADYFFWVNSKNKTASLWEKKKGDMKPLAQNFPVLLENQLFAIELIFRKRSLQWFQKGVGKPKEKVEWKGKFIPCFLVEKNPKKAIQIDYLEVKIQKTK